MQKDRFGRRQPFRPRRKRIRWKGILVLLVAALLVLGVLLFLGRMIVSFFSGPTVTAPSAAAATDKELNSHINVLVMGIDEGDNDYKGAPKRTDTLLLASFYPKDNVVTALSLPRDTRVNIPGQAKPTKLGHAYAFGGPNLCRQTVANLLQVPIHHQVVANFRGFVALVDLLGGVDVFVDRDMDYDDPYQDLHIHIKQGYQHLDGAAAGGYVRFRHDELGDIGRVQRQQKFLKAMGSRIFSFTNILKLPYIIGTVHQYVYTDMDAWTVFRLLRTIPFFGKERIKLEMLYGSFATIDNASYWVTTKEKVERALNELGIPHGEILSLE